MGLRFDIKVSQSTSCHIPRPTRKATMRSVSIIALLAFVAHAHAEEPVANVQDDSQNEDASMDQFAHMLMDKLADKLLDFGVIDNDDQLDEEQLGEVEDYAVDEAMKAMAAMKAMKAM